MEIALRFEELTNEDLYVVEGGKAYDVGYQIGKYLGIFLTCIIVLV